MSIAITARQRELFYGLVLSRLTAIDDVWRAVDSHEWDRAQELGREFSDLLRLVVDDLGWGEGREEAVRFTTPPDVLRRAIGILRREALIEDTEQREKRLEVAEAQLERADTVEACDEILAQLAGESVPS